MSETYEIHDERFASLIDQNAGVEILHTGCRWTEGGVWVAGEACVLWSDIPNNQILRWDAADGSVSVFREPCMKANGHILDREGRLVSCEHLSRAVSRTGHDGIREVLVDRYQGKRLNSPNDVVVRSDGTIWFTDPTYGIDDNKPEDEQFPSETDGQFVFRFDPDTGDIDAVITDMQLPNGLAFSLDETILYVADSGKTHAEDGNHHIRKFDVSDDGKSLSGGEVFASADVGIFDGFRIDVEDRLWASAGDGIHCYAPDGKLLGKILIPEVVANVCFGGENRDRLFICATKSLYSVTVKTQGGLRPGEAA